MERTDSRNKNTQYIGTTLLFIIAGGLIGTSTYIGFISQNTRTVIKAGMAIISLVAWFVLRRSERLQQFKQIAISFFAVSLGVLLAQFFGNIPLKLLGYSITTVQGVAIAKFGEALPIVLSILVVHFASGGDINGLFLGSGNLKFGLIAGIIGFSAFAGLGYFQAMDSGISGARVGTALPWILIFIFSNAFMEELWFRALFIKKLEPLVGTWTTLIITSLVFASVHISSTYVIDILIFLVELMALALLWGWLMRKSDSIWGSVMIHAGADVLVIMSFLAGANL